VSARSLGILVRDRAGHGAACVVALVVGCARTEPASDGETGGKSRRASEVVASASAPARPSLKEALRLECGELPPEPLTDELPGKGSARLVPAASSQLPTGAIAYVSDGKVRVVLEDGRRRVLGPGSRPSWHPRATSLLFLSSVADGLPRLFEVTLDCSASRMLTGPLTSAASADEVAYALSPDGERVAFTRQLDGRSPLYVVERATGDERKLADDLASSELAWLPDSQSLAYLAGDLEDSSLMRLEVRTGRARKVAAVKRGLLTARRTGSVLFQSAFGVDNSIEARQARLYLTEGPDGPVRLLKGSEIGPGDYDSLRVSPDGTKLAAPWSLWTGNGPAAIRDHGLALFDLSPSRKTAGPAAELGAPGRPFGAADGAIRFTRPRARNLGVSGERYAARSPSWAPDSRHLAFELADCGESFTECRSRIVAVDTAAAGAPLVFLASGAEPAWAPVP
jgi:dipeptidyl aminopeptidase/acylaminoacyl peptidase